MATNRNDRTDDLKGRINWIDDYQPVSKEQFDKDIEEWKKRQEAKKKKREEEKKNKK